MILWSGLIGATPKSSYNKNYNSNLIRLSSYEKEYTSKHFSNLQGSLACQLLNSN